MKCKLKQIKCYIVSRVFSKILNVSVGNVCSEFLFQNMLICQKEDLESCYILIFQGSYYLLIHLQCSFYPVASSWQFSASITNLLHSVISNKWHLVSALLTAVHILYVNVFPWKWNSKLKVGKFTVEWKLLGSCLL